MAFFTDRSGLVSFFGLISQCSVAWIFALLLSALGVAAGPRPYLRAWKRAAWACAAGLSALAISQALVRVGVSTPRTLQPLLLAFYQCAKLAFLGFTLEGAIGAAGLPGAAYLRWLWGSLLALALASLPFARSAEALIALQSLALAPGSFLAVRALSRHPARRHRIGLRVASAALLAHALVWPLYAAGAALSLRGELGSGAELTLLGYPLLYNSFLDLALMVLLLCGELLVVMEEIQSEKERAQAEEERLAAELRGLSRLRTIGWLVAGVAHELNNPLTVILGFSEELEQHAESAPAQHAGRVIRERAQLCRGIVRSLSSIAGERPPQRERIEPAALLQRVARSVEYPASRAGVRVLLQLGEDLRWVNGEPIGLEQALVNLAVNAVQASPPGGVVQLCATRSEVGVEFSFEDEGSGIPSALRERVFEPFFTTKAPGQGTGLGLALAKAIVQAHGGSIFVSDRETGASGAQFVVRLPLAQEECSQPTAAAPRTVPPDEGLRVLVVDDDSEIRAILKRLGLKQGWRVETAVDGLEALEILRRKGAHYDVVLCDLRLPRLDGVELHDRLLEEAPALLRRFVFLTGDRAYVRSSGFGARVAAPILYKPFDLEELGQALRERSDAAGSPLPASAGTHASTVRASGN